MFRNKKLMYRRLMAKIIVVLLLFIFSVPAYPQINNMAFLLQQTPPQAGTVSPDLGVHSFTSGSQVTLTAVPKQGYQFVYWIGDVSDPTSSSTTALADSPKIIVAVFQRTEHDFLAQHEYEQWAYGGRFPVALPEFPLAWVGAPGGSQSSASPGEIPPDPIPEPATIILLASGFYLAGKLKKRRT